METRHPVEGVRDHFPFEGEFSAICSPNYCEVFKILKTFVLIMWIVMSGLNCFPQD